MGSLVGLTQWMHGISYDQFKGQNLGQYFVLLWFLDSWMNGLNCGKSGMFVQLPFSICASTSKPVSHALAMLAYRSIHHC